MKFYSTRGGDVANNAAEAIVKGLASDGGLFVPEYFPDIYKEIDKLIDMSYAERATEVIGSFLSEYDNEGLKTACEKAYAKFENGEPAPIVKIDDKTYVMELFHGPTLAFKDVALTLLPYLLRKGADMCGIKENILILVATSGDTGKAALSGFADQEGIKIMVLYPSDGVSDMQKLQMRTQEGANVNVVGIKGNFDDCQTTAKNIFSSKKAAQLLKEKNTVLSSANSINFGRLVPQITYYFSAYCDLVASEQIKKGDKVNFVVPTGNFGNILAGYYAKRMGLPINKLVCASNDNNVLTEFFASGVYDKNRDFYKTISPSMDILLSSNLERFVFELSGRDGEKTLQRMQELKSIGKYNLKESEFNLLENDFFASYADEEECRETVSSIFEEYGYLVDTHTAVALKVLRDFKAFTDDKISTVTLSTASPYKFPQSIYDSLTGKNLNDAFKACELLEKETAEPVPEQIRLLKTKEIRFNDVIEKEAVFDSVMNFIK